MLRLQSATPQEWTDRAVTEIEELLIDHAHCEKKASQFCLSLINSNPEKVELVEVCTKLAIEELKHFKQVYQLLKDRGQELTPDKGDVYVQKLKKEALKTIKYPLLDKLLISSLIESRSYERLDLLSKHISCENLKDFYLKLARSEKGHAKIFKKLADTYFEENFVNQRLNTLIDIEYSVISQLPITSNIH